jgi:hypothetical protein
MTLLELLDKIDETAPKSCKTCRHMATHARCTGCLEDVPESNERCTRFFYHHWEPGNWLRELHAAELAGTKNIVLGGSGEAEVNANHPPQATSSHLNYVAEQCGYVYGSLVTCGNESRKKYWTSCGEFEIFWLNGRLERIDRIYESGKRACEWSRHHADPSEANQESEVSHV